MNRSPKGRKPQYFKDPATDKLLDMVVKLTAELSVTRDRLDALERTLENKDIEFSRSELSQYKESDTAAVERDAHRNALIAQVLQVLEDEVNEVAKPDALESIDGLMEELARTE